MDCFTTSGRVAGCVAELRGGEGFAAGRLCLRGWEPRQRSAGAEKDGLMESKLSTSMIGYQGIQVMNHDWYLKPSPSYEVDRHVIRKLISMFDDHRLVMISCNFTLTCQSPPGCSDMTVSTVNQQGGTPREC